MPQSAAADADKEQTGTIQWFLQRAPRKQPKRQPCMPHLALRSANNCQQLLARELGWCTPPSLNTWHLVQQQHLACIRMLAPQDALRGNQASVTCLQLQQQQLSSNTSSSLAAVGYSHGVLYICRLVHLQHAAAAALSAAATLPGDVQQAQTDPYAQQPHAATRAGLQSGVSNVPEASPAAGSIWRLDTEAQLRSCCWLQKQANSAAAAGTGRQDQVLVTSGPAGVMQRSFAEGRVINSSLRQKGGAKVNAPGKVIAADPEAAYHLAAATAEGLLLWDLRAGPAASALLPAPAVSQHLLQPMPGGELLLVAAKDGQVCLYDVRRFNSNSNVIAFGKSKASQQVVATYNLAARIQQAELGWSGGSSGSSIAGYMNEHTLSSSSSSMGVASRRSWFLDDIALNPADPNLLAYVRSDMQVGLFDLYANKVQQQVPLREDVGPIAEASGSSPDPDPYKASTRVCWDSSGRIAYTHGLLSEMVCVGGNSGTRLTPTLAAVDFGSWRGRQQRRWQATVEAAAGDGSGASGWELDSGSGSTNEANRACDGTAAAEGDGVSAGAENGCSGSGRVCGRGLLSQGGQVLHVQLHPSLAPSGLAATGGNGQVLVGSVSGDVMWFG